MFSDAVFAYRLVNVIGQNGETCLERILTRGDTKGMMSFWNIKDIGEMEIIAKENQAGRLPGMIIHK